MSINCLFDVPGFEALKRPLSELNLGVTLRGGVVRRLASLVAKGRPPKSPLELFDVAPFASDIDLTHTGEPSDSELISELISEHVPWAEAMRWEIRDEESCAEIDEAADYNSVIPAAQISLSSNPNIAWIDPLNGRKDIRERRFRFIRNPKYGDSPLYKNGRDLEFFSVLLFLRILTEAGESARPTAEADKQASEVVTAIDVSSTIAAMRSHPYLTYRVANLLRQLVADGFNPFHDESFGLGEKLLAIGERLPRLRFDAIKSQKTASLLSSFLPDRAVSRCEETDEDWLTGKRAKDRCARLMSKENLELAPDLERWEIAYFEYDWTQSIERSAEELSNTLRARYPETGLTLVGHSMGGLVCRLTALRADRPTIRLIFLLGTPNLGAFRTAQLGVLAQLTKATVGKVWGMNPRYQGLLDLTRVDKLFASHLEAKSYDDTIDYVSIPGCFFHEGRDVESGFRDVGRTGFSTLDLFTVFATGRSPFWTVRLQRPHDGIVERSSNCLIPSSYGRRSEKDRSINDIDQLEPATYAHVEAFPTCGELLHVDIHRNAEVIALVLDIASFKRLSEWQASVKDHRRLRISTRNPSEGPY